jgi:hypothetical protein
VFGEVALASMGILRFLNLKKNQQILEYFRFRGFFFFFLVAISSRDLSYPHAGILT